MKMAEEELARCKAEEDELARCKAEEELAGPKRRRTEAAPPVAARPEVSSSSSSAAAPPPPPPPPRPPTPLPPVPYHPQGEDWRRGLYGGRQRVGNSGGSRTDFEWKIAVSSWIFNALNSASEKCARTLVSSTCPKQVVDILFLMLCMKHVSIRRKSNLIAYLPL